MLQKIGICEIQDLYDFYIIDLWGVVHNGFDAYPGVIDCLNELIARNKTIIYLSNAPRPSKVVMEKLISLGVPVKPEMILTSGDITRQALEHYTLPIYHLGAARNQDLLAGLKVNVVDRLQDATLLLISAYLDQGEAMRQYDAILQEAYQLKLPAICANPDKEVMHGNELRFCAGTFAKKYVEIGGTVQYFGKPYIDIYQNIFRTLKLKNIVDKKRILMIGDTIETDLLGAKMAEIDSAIVLTGNMSTLLLKNTLPNVSNLEFLTQKFQMETVKPTWILPSLIW